jgi:outer membrane protein assembly factor BamB
MSRTVGRSGEMRDVELLESGSSTSGPTRSLRLYQWAAAGLTIAVVATAAVVQHRADARADAREARLAAVDGILSPLDGPPVPRWTLDHPVASVTYGRPADGVLLGGSSIDQAIEFHGVDVETGEVLWRTPVEVPVDETLWSWCDPVSTSAGAALAVCTAGPDAPAAAVALASRTMWTLVPRTGEVLASWRVPGDSSALVTDDQLVMASTQSADEWQVQSLDPATARPLWTFIPPVSLSQADFVQPQLVDDGAGRVLVSLGGHAWLLDASGRVVLDRATPHGTWWVPLRTGSLLGRVVTRGSPPKGIAVLPNDVVIPLAEQPVPVVPDDGTAPDVILTLDTSPAVPVLAARSATTGDVMWRRTGSVLAALVLDGTLYLGGAQGLAAVDARTGDVRWTRDTGYSVNQMSTDGDELVVVEPPSTVSAFGLRDGSPSWSSDVEATEGIGPLASVDLAPGSRAVVARGRDGSVTVLG